MRTSMELFGALAGLFTYPDEGVAAHVEQLEEALADRPLVRAEIEPFLSFVRATPAGGLEDLFTRTFDLNPSCCLDIGWHLYGEDYQRGRFMVMLRGQLRAAGIAENGELPDHLSHVLKLLAALPQEDAELFARQHVLPAVDKIRSKCDAENPYTVLVHLVQSTLAERYGRMEDRSPEGLPVNAAESKREVLEITNPRRG